MRALQAAPRRASGRDLVRSSRSSTKSSSPAKRVTTACTSTSRATRFGALAAGRGQERGSRRGARGRFDGRRAASRSSPKPRGRSCARSQSAIFELPCTADASRSDRSPLLRSRRASRRRPPRAAPRLARRGHRRGTRPRSFVRSVRRRPSHGDDGELSQPRRSSSPRSSTCRCATGSSAGSTSCSRRGSASTSRSPMPMPLHALDTRLHPSHVAEAKRVAAARAARPAAEPSRTRRRTPTPTRSRRSSRAPDPSRAAAALDRAGELAAPVAAVRKERRERRFEAARRLGLAHPFSLASTIDVGAAARRCSTRRSRSPSSSSRASRKKAEFPWRASSAIEVGLARDARDGWPSRLTQRWLDDAFKALAPRGVDAGPLPEPLGAASFLRAAAAWGFAWRTSGAPRSMPFALARDPYPDAGVPLRLRARVRRRRAVVPEARPRAPFAARERAGARAPHDHVPSCAHDRRARAARLGGAASRPRRSRSSARVSSVRRCPTSMRDAWPDPRADRRVTSRRAARHARVPRASSSIASTRTGSATRGRASTSRASHAVPRSTPSPLPTARPRRSRVRSKRRSGDRVSGVSRDGPLGLRRDARSGRRSRRALASGAPPKPAPRPPAHPAAPSFRSRRCRCCRASRA